MTRPGSKTAMTMDTAGSLVAAIPPVHLDFLIWACNEFQFNTHCLLRSPSPDAQTDCSNQAATAQPHAETFQQHLPPLYLSNLAAILYMNLYLADAPMQLFTTDLYGRVAPEDTTLANNHQTALKGFVAA